jgi:hypothetical protein
MKQGIIYKQQIEGVEGALPSRLAAVCGAVLGGTVTALLLGSNALLNWVNNLPIGPVSDNLLQAAQEWQNWMATAGIAKISAALANGLTAFQSMRW